MAFDCSLMYVEYVRAYTVVSCSLCHINIQLHNGCISRGISRNVEGGVHIVCRTVGTNFVVLQPLLKVVHRSTALLRCIKVWLTNIYVTQKDYGITWLICWSSSQLLCEVAKCSYAFGHPKYVWICSCDSSSVVPLVEGLWVLETTIFICFSNFVL